MIEIRPATLCDAHELAQRMRPGDEAEVRALGFSPLMCVVESINSAPEAWSWVTSDGVGAIFGVTPLGLLSDTAIIWCLTAEPVNTHRVAYVKASKQMVKYYLTKYVKLINWVDARYIGALRWAAALGFKINEPLAFGLMGEPFCKIEIGG